MTANKKSMPNPDRDRSGHPDARQTDTDNENRVGGLPERQPNDRLSQDDNKRSEQVIQPQRIRGNGDPDRASVDASED